MNYDLSILKLIGPHREATNIHFHYNNEIIFVTHGSLVMNFEGVSCPVKANQLIVISSLAIHTLEKVSNDCSRIIYRFSSEFLFDAIKDPSLMIIFNRSSNLSIPIFTLTGNKIVIFKELFSLLQMEFNTKHDLFENRCQVFLSTLLIILYRVDSSLFMKNKNPTITKIYKIQSYLNQHYKKSITIEHISKEFSISKSYLEHNFIEVTGLSIKRYIIRTRIVQAKKLLCCSDKNISEISEELGFYDSNYFIKQFKKLEQITPLQYRKKFFAIREMEVASAQSQS